MNRLYSVFPQPSVSAGIVFLWIALGGWSAGNFILALVLATLIPHATNAFWPDRPRMARPIAAVKLFAVVLLDIVRANWDVARLVVGPLDRLHPKFVEVPIDLDDPFVATLLASIVSLTPGTVSVEIDMPRRQVLVHALDVTDTSGMIATIKERYEAPLKEVFQC